MQSRIHFPAEWETQDAVMITWPHQDSAWVDQLESISQTYVDFCSKLSHYQTVLIQIHESIDINILLSLLAKNSTNLSNLLFVQMNSNDTWARDHGPISVIKDGSVVCLNFRFNGWGNKFVSELDNSLNLQLLSKNVLPEMESIDWVLEGGSIESDGDGSLLTTEACLLNPNRNGLVDRSNVEKRLQEYFGSQQVIWLQHGEISGDDTDSHVDTLARFAPSNTIIYQGCDDPSDPHYTHLKKMAKELEMAKNRHGVPYQLVELPLPSPVFAKDGHRLPATYANFLITNKLVLVPIYEDDLDYLAIEKIQQVFVDHIVVGVNSLTLIEEHGSLHCITMQLPEGSLNPNADYEKAVFTS